MLTNFVVVLQPCMFSSYLQALTGHRQRLILTHHVHITGLLVIKIQDDDRRDETLAVMATKLTTTLLLKPFTLDVSGVIAPAPGGG